MNDHQKFLQLTEDTEVFREVMKHNCTGKECTFQEWSDKRKFIAKAIHANGSLLDIGCAGGFFVRSLMEWSDFTIVPYGIDLNKQYIIAAQELLSDLYDNFQLFNIRDIKTKTIPGFPEHFDFVYVSVFDLNIDSNIHFIKEYILPLAKKRLIVGSYGTNMFSIDSSKWQLERDYIGKGIENLKKVMNISGSQFNPTKYNQAIAWIDIK